MPFSRPLLSDLISRTRNDVVSRLPSADILRRSNGEVYARVLAGGMHEVYGYVAWLANQLIYDTAETFMLDRWASIWGLTRKVATAATGTVAVTGSSGVDVPLGSVLATYDGTLYVTTADVVLSGGAGVLPVIAQVPASASTRLAGQTFTFQPSIAGVVATGVGSAMTGGTDLETDDSLRARLLTRIKNPPQGGSASDYVNWALAVARVTRAWCYPGELGAGCVTVRFMMDNSYANGIPLPGDVAAVAAALALVKPVTAALTVVAPLAAVLNVSITALNPMTAAVQAAVVAELAALVGREAVPGGTIYLSHIREAIGLAAGEIDYTLVSPSANVVAATGYITTMGTVSWV